MEYSLLNLYILCDTVLFKGNFLYASAASVEKKRKFYCNLYLDTFIIALPLSNAQHTAKVFPKTILTFLQLLATLYTVIFCLYFFMNYNYHSLGQCHFSGLNYFLFSCCLCYVFRYLKPLGSEL